jgi:YjbE family integral membrane protein
MIENILNVENISWVAFFQVVMIDLIFSGDNAIVIGIAAAGLPPEQRRKAISIGIAAAVVMRIIFALVVVWLLTMPWLKIVGGVLLLYITWKLAEELRKISRENAEDEETKPEPKSLMQAAWLIVISDLSLSLDNVLAVAAAGKDSPLVIVIGLVLSIVMMIFFATLIARTLKKYPLIGWVGASIILWVGVDMVWNGVLDTFPGIIS